MKHRLHRIADGRGYMYRGLVVLRGERLHGAGRLWHVVLPAPGRGRMACASLTDAKRYVDHLRNQGK